MDIGYLSCAMYIFVSVTACMSTSALLFVSAHMNYVRHVKCRNIDVLDGGGEHTLLRLSA